MSATISSWLQRAQAELETSGISTARLDCLVLLEDETGKDRAWLLSHPEFKLQGSVFEILNTKITRRSQHIPLAYIRGKAEFYGREFAVNAHTLVPRPETETMIDIFKTLMPEVGPPALAESIAVCDIGTGSGAIAITAKLELPGAQVIATDIDEICLETARANAQVLGAEISSLRGDLLEPLSVLTSLPSALILLCNLPYVPDNFQINTAATHEPRRALFGGPDGLDLYRKMFTQIQSSGWKPTYILTESLPPQHEVLVRIAAEHGYRSLKTDDFIQVFEPIT